MTKRQSEPPQLVNTPIWNHPHPYSCKPCSTSLTSLPSRLWCTCSLRTRYYYYFFILKKKENINNKKNTKPTHSSTSCVFWEMATRFTTQTNKQETTLRNWEFFFFFFVVVVCVLVARGEKIKGRDAERKRDEDWEERERRTHTHINNKRHTTETKQTEFLWVLCVCVCASLFLNFFLLVFFFFFFPSITFSLCVCVCRVTSCAFLTRTSKRMVTKKHKNVMRVCVSFFFWRRGGRGGKMAWVCFYFFVSFF